MHCLVSDFHSIKPIVQGEEIERFLAIDRSLDCFLWYVNISEYDSVNEIQKIGVWVFDPENADASELHHSAQMPSVNSRILTRQFIDMGQEPILYSYLQIRTFTPKPRTDFGIWEFLLSIKPSGIILKIIGKPVAFQDCFIADSYFIIGPSQSEFHLRENELPLSAPKNSELIVKWSECLPVIGVLLSEFGVFYTNDGFRSARKIKSPILDDRRFTVSNVAMSESGIFILINGSVYLETPFHDFLSLVDDYNFPKTEIIGITSRKWCLFENTGKISSKLSKVILWSIDTVYLGYTGNLFVKLTTVTELREILKLPLDAAITIANMEYTLHPSDITLLLSYCSPCGATKSLYLATYWEDKKQWILEDLSWQVPVQNAISLLFLNSAVPNLLLWDDRNMYYSYQNHLIQGFLQMFKENESLPEGDFIHQVFLDYYGNVIIKTKFNQMFHLKCGMKVTVKLHPWVHKDKKTALYVNPTGDLFILSINGSDTVIRETYPLTLEIFSSTQNTEDTCPYILFHHNINSYFYFMDKSNYLIFWAQIVYPELLGLSVVVEVYGPKILKEDRNEEYEIVLGICTKNLTLKFFQDENYEQVDNYTELQQKNSGILSFAVIPSTMGKRCILLNKVSTIYVGCNPKRYITVKGVRKENCTQYENYHVSISKLHLRHRPNQDLNFIYDLKKYGCPMKFHWGQYFQPIIELYEGKQFVERVKANFIIWDIYGRNDYSFNSTMNDNGCMSIAQTWSSMIAANTHLPLDKVWGPENYRHCFSVASGKPGNLNQPYEILNSSNYNYIVWPKDYEAFFVFQVKIVDPNYSFCDLTATFAVHSFILAKRPDPTIVLLCVICLFLGTVFGLSLSYLEYVNIFRNHLDDQTPTETNGENTSEN
ncbi:cation channel sperm-associated protein subunit epsilon isoform X2 [Tachyglossus aculeatus]|nr:cation channel sperm-associated protein subunit epsilon isoform X2 [Tachyglossus aculeatus]XP_038617377.1 cation channel sperm-associated protein subunit epsilon isoform X2 [Tachyglossus aculeatus]XP_038617378.1 cation channel sperm-associated protein subunit epsilon isoform X2 [Tachyglossus aculeatus]XP_038617379.1 cation channel sperm-associated protein subunit epsilon isoform X2 [Tachyglossus aculeatus]